MLARSDQFAPSQQRHSAQQSPQVKAARLHEEGFTPLRRLQWMMGAALAVLVLNAAIIVMLNP